MANSKRKTLSEPHDTKPHSQGILQQLLRAGEVSVDELAAHLRVSPSTDRRYLNALEQQGLLRRTHGGAVVKRRVGLAAAELIADGEIIANGAGTTTTQVARGSKPTSDFRAGRVSLSLTHTARPLVRIAPEPVWQSESA